MHPSATSAILAMLFVKTGARSLTQNRAHAIVIGASVAGLLAARVLADHFERVTLIERDKLPRAAEHRGGVPQGRHIHGLLARGLQILEALFPGFERELDAAGAPRIEWMHDTLQLLSTGWTPHFHSNFYSRPCSRLLLESLIRRRVLALPNVELLEGYNASELIGASGRVTGIRLDTRRRGEGEARSLDADLVVDASGRGSQAPEWLAALGFERPKETHVNAHLGYATRLYRLPHHPGWRALFMMTTPALPRGGVFIEIENGVWMLTLAGTAGDLPPTDEAGLLTFARSIPAPPLHAAMEQAEPLSPIYGYQRTANRLRHFEKLPRFPRGFVAMGDAVCAFNPIYGQGMTAAALGAVELERWLKAGDDDGRRFQKRLARRNADAWMMATYEDFRYPTEGAQPPPIARILNGYVDWMFDAAPDVPQIPNRFLRVMHLVMPPVSLFDPRLIIRRLLWRPSLTPKVPPDPQWVGLQVERPVNGADEPPAAAHYQTEGNSSIEDREFTQ
jgi:2-polyprenyl-6-methoxyphenol hydroxylase-like FAD-dependent oxidoreductase